MTREEMRERVADLVRFNKDPVAIAEEAIAIIRGETLEEAAREVLPWIADMRVRSTIAATIRALAAPSGALKEGK